MKKILFLLFSIFILTSCDTSYECDNIYELSKKEEYRKSFVDVFSVNGVLNIDREHNWGFSNFVTTRSVNPNSNEWYVIPDDITEDERTYVVNWFNSHKNPMSLSVNWSDYFVQQVHGQDSQLDKLICSEDGIHEYDHVYNFNASSGTIQLMQNSTSNAFAYHNSRDSKDHYKYVIVNIRGSYYVGFDAEATGNNPNQQQEADGFYSDWIVKITPCLPKDGVGKRIMAEDLGAIGDFDFNDVVFDVYINYNEWWHDGDYGIIILQAAGGTLPIYVAGEEIHEKFGVPTNMVTNTANNITHAPAVWRFKPISANPKDVSIIVNNNGNVYGIDADQGEAPGKICVPNTVMWTSEGQNISNKYPKFRYWIEDKNYKFWE